MGPISRWSVNNPWKALFIWALLMVGVFTAAGALKAGYNDSFQLPNTESTTAQNLLIKQFPAFQPKGADSAAIVFGANRGSVLTPANAAAAQKVLAQVKKNKSVVSITSPFDPAAARAAAQQRAAAQGAGPSPLGTAASFVAPVSKDGSVAKATVLIRTTDGKANSADVAAIDDIIIKANTETLKVGVSGRVFDFAQGKPPKTEGIGIIVALIIMAIMFGAVVAAGLPIVTAGFGLATGLAAVTVFTNIADIPTFAPILASLIGWGVGIDYSLFVINRFKAAVDAGKEPRVAAIESVNTSGRAVLFAGTTVIVALAGLFVLRINFINGLATASMLTVFTVMLSALWLLPAVISLLGRRAYALKLPWARKPRKLHPRGTAFARYGEWLQGRPLLLVIGALVVMAIIALPTLGLQQGFADASGKKPGNPSRTGYELLTKAFGPGVNGPFIVVVELPRAGALSGAYPLAAAIQRTQGVAGATNPVPSDLKSPQRSTAALITVYPTSAPQDQATQGLLNRLREEVIPAATKGTGVKAYVGGTKAITIDFGRVLSDALPLFLVIVIGLGIVALSILFRSLLVPVIGALASLISYGAALGISVAVFQWGWIKDLFGVQATGPIAPFVPVFLFAILFGLSMDYQV
ncbi:MAG TPA: hypothetical protein DCM51_03995, partial [Actinobacteria bacterium]|nr:hypothetical protein [Actinomycetota bacterium]